MDTKRLAAFVKVVDVGSVTRAAHLLNVAQPGLSQQILSLEGDFKTRLLDRSPRGVTPTPAGKTLYRHARKILRQMDEALTNVKEADVMLRGNVSVGLAAWSHASLMAKDLIATVREEYPGILLRVWDAFPLPFSEMILRGQIDMAYSYGGVEARGLSYVDFGREEFVLVLPPKLDPQGTGPVDVQFLSSVPLILPPDSSLQRGLVERVCASIGETPNVVVEILTLEILTSLLAEGIGGAMLPTSVASTLAKQGDLRIRDIDVDMSMPMVLCTPMDDAPTDAVEAVRGVLLELINRQ